MTKSAYMDTSNMVTYTVDIGKVPEYLQEHDDSLLAWLEAPSVHGQNPALKELDERLKQAQTLTLEEQKHHYKQLMKYLKATSQMSKGVREGDVEGFAFEEECNIYPPSVTAQKYIQKVYELDVASQQPTAAVAKAIQIMSGDKPYLNAFLRKNINDEVVKYSRNREEAIQKDVKRNSIVVTTNGEIHSFNDIKEFQSWGKQNGLTGEQVGVVLSHYHQGVGLGLDNPYYVRHGIETKEGIVHGLAGFAPTMLIDISGDKVTMQSQMSGKLLGPDEPPTTISTLKADITNLTASEYRAGLTTTPIEYEFMLTTTDTAKLSGELYKPLNVIGGTQIESSLHIELYIKAMIQALEVEGDLKGVGKGEACDVKLLAEYLAKTVPPAMLSKVLQEASQQYKLNPEQSFALAVNSAVRNGVVDLNTAITNAGAVGQNPEVVYEYIKENALKVDAKKTLKGLTADAAAQLIDKLAKEGSYKDQLTTEAISATNSADSRRELVVAVAVQQKMPVAKALEVILGSATLKQKTNLGFAVKVVRSLGAAINNPKIKKQMLKNPRRIIMQAAQDFKVTPTAASSRLEKRAVLSNRIFGAPLKGCDSVKLQPVVSRESTITKVVNYFRSRLGANSVSSRRSGTLSRPTSRGL